jgi:hypothetical protein
VIRNFTTFGKCYNFTDRRKSGYMNIITETNSFFLLCRPIDKWFLVPFVCSMLRYKIVIVHIHKVIKKSLYTQWLLHRKLKVMFKVSPASLQTFIDTKFTLTPSVIPNSNYFINVSDWNCLKYFCDFFTVIIRCTQAFWSPGTFYSLHIRTSFVIYSVKIIFKWGVGGWSYDICPNVRGRVRRK